jgi:hypothetical protein
MSTSLNYIPEMTVGIQRSTVGMHARRCGDRSDAEPFDDPSSFQASAQGVGYTASPALAGPRTGWRQPWAPRKPWG